MGGQTAALGAPVEVIFSKQVDEKLYGPRLSYSTRVRCPYIHDLPGCQDR
jgi:hypothetical protein